VPDASKAGLQLDQLQKSVADLQTRQVRIEQAILANPIKALEIPLLQRDLDGLKTAQQDSILALRQNVDRVYDLNKWLLGAMAVSIVTLAISNFLKG
jgi:hypothetical protein